MPQQTYRNINWGWDIGEGGWKTGVDNNFLRLGVLLTPSVLAIVTSPAVTTDETVYIVGVGGTGDFAGQDNDFAYRIDGAWSFLTPGAGQLAYDQANNRLIAFNGSVWSTNGFSFTFV